MMKKSRRIPTAIGVLTALTIAVAPVAVSTTAQAAVINVDNQAKRYHGTREYPLPALSVTDWCLTKGGFDRNLNEQTWKYTVTVKNDSTATAALHVNDRSTNVDTSATRWRVIVLRPGKSQAVTISPMTRIYGPQLTESLQRDISFSGVIVRATKGQIKKLRSGARAKGLLHFDENSSRSLPVTFTGAHMCPGQDPASNAGGMENELGSRDEIYAFTGAEMMSDQLPREAYLSQFSGYRDDRANFVRTWTAHAVKGWDDAAAGRPMLDPTVDLDTFMPREGMNANQTAYAMGYLQALGYYDYRSGHDSRAERLAGAPSSVRTIEWVFEYTQGWELAEHYTKYPYRAA